MKKFLLVFILLFNLAHADSIQLPNLGKAATGTSLGGGKYGLDINLPPGAVSINGSVVIGTPNAPGDSGLTSLSVRKDSSGPITGVADGDYTPLLVDSNGDLRVVGSNAANAADGAAAPAVGGMVGGYDGTNLQYLSVDSTGKLNINVSAHSGKSYSDSARNVYSITNVTTGAWVELIASTAAAATEIQLFDSSGQTLELGIGGSGSESRVLIVSPGGNGAVPLSIPSGSRLSVRAISATASVGELDITLLN